MHRGLAGRGRPLADFGEPRGLSRAARAFVLGRFLGASRRARCGRPGARARPRTTPPRNATALAARLARSLFASIESTRARRGLDFIPGSVEWADFDPTATANAIYLFDVPDGLDRAAVERTFDKYLADWRAKRSGEVPAPNYTPYEIRIIGALVRLGRREAALELLRFFLVGPPAAAVESVARDRLARPQGARARRRSAAYLDLRRVRARRAEPVRLRDRVAAKPRAGGGTLAGMDRGRGRRGQGDADALRRR